jgi:hypothetical protein
MPRPATRKKCLHGRVHRAGERDSRCELREGRGRAAPRWSTVCRAVDSWHHVSGRNVNSASGPTGEAIVAVGQPHHPRRGGDRPRSNQPIPTRRSHQSNPEAQPGHCAIGELRSSAGAIVWLSLASVNDSRRAAVVVGTRWLPTSGRYRVGTAASVARRSPEYRSHTNAGVCPQPARSLPFATSATGDGG